MNKKIGPFLISALATLLYPSPIRSMKNGTMPTAQQTITKKLCKATENEDLVTVKKLIKDTPEAIDQTDEFGNTPVHIAAEEGYTAILSELIKNKAKIDLKNDFAVTPLHNACLNKNFGAIKLLVKNGANINTKDSEGSTVLHIASRLGSLKLLYFLLSHNALINLKNYDGETCLHIAIENRCSALVEILIAANIDIDAVNRWGETALHIAASVGDLAAMRQLIVHKADHSCRDLWGRTALDLAVKNRDFVTASYLNLVSNFKATLNGTVPFIQFACYYLTPTQNRFDDTKQLLPLDKQGDFTKKFNMWCKMIKSIGNYTK